MSTKVAVAIVKGMGTITADFTSFTVLLVLLGGLTRQLVPLE